MNSKIPKSAAETAAAKQVKMKNSLKSLERYLESKGSFRYNIVSKRPEFRKNAITGATYEDMTDHDYNSLWRGFARQGGRTNVGIIRNLLASDFIPRYDPYLDYLNGLTKWDGKFDFISQLAATVKPRGCDEGFWTFCFHKWFIGMVSSWNNTTEANHLVLIFNGKQGIGKTAWFRTLVPESLKNYIYAGSVNPADKDSIVNLSECPLIVMDELENLGKKRLDSLKEMITKSSIRVRRAYAYAPEKLVRRASFAGSINTSHFLTDMTGNRRFLCFDVESIDYQHSVPIDNAIAQALVLIESGYEHWLNAEEIELINSNNEMFRDVNQEEESLLAHFEPCTRDEATHLLPTSKIASMLSVLDSVKLSDQILGRVLNAKGFQRVKHEERYKYLLKEKK